MGDKIPSPWKHIVYVVFPFKFASTVSPYEIQTNFSNNYITFSKTTMYASMLVR